MFRKNSFEILDFQFQKLIRLRIELMVFLVKPEHLIKTPDYKSFSELHKESYIANFT